MHITSIVSDGLVAPYDMAIGSHDEIYVINDSTETGTAEVLRLR